MRTSVLFCAVTALFVSGSVQAEPLLGPNAKPGLVTAWSTASGITTLTLAEGVDADAVAQLIIDSIKGAQAKPNGERVLITGIGEARLLSQLQGLDLSTEDDDVDAMLSELQNPGGDDDGSGSSIRAGKKVQLHQVAGPPGPLVDAEVLQVQHARYPLVVVTVKVRRGPKSGKGPRPGDTIRVVPYVKSKGGVVDPKHPQSQLNVGAWYVQKGDRVRLRLEEKARKKLWVAKAFERAK